MELNRENIRNVYIDCLIDDEYELSTLKELIKEERHKEKQTECVIVSKEKRQPKVFNVENLNRYKDIIKAWIDSLEISLSGTTLEDITNKLGQSKYEKDTIERLLSLAVACDIIKATDRYETCYSNPNPQIKSTFISQIPNYILNASPNEMLSIIKKLYRNYQEIIKALGIELVFDEQSIRVYYNQEYINSVVPQFNYSNVFLEIPNIDFRMCKELDKDETIITFCNAVIKIIDNELRVYLKQEDKTVELAFDDNSIEASYSGKDQYEPSSSICISTKSMFASVENSTGLDKTDQKFSLILSEDIAKRHCTLHVQGYEETWGGDICKDYQDTQSMYYAQAMNLCDEILRLPYTKNVVDYVLDTISELSVELKDILMNNEDFQDLYSKMTADLNTGLIASIIMEHGLLEDMIPVINQPVQYVKATKESE